MTRCQLCGGRLWWRYAFYLGAIEYRWHVGACPGEVREPQRVRLQVARSGALTMAEVQRLIDEAQQ